jgi:hypothetical protein
MLVDQSAHSLGVLDPDPECLLGVGQVGLVEDAEEHDRGVLLADVHGLVVDDPGGEEERQGRDAADLLAVLVVDLDKRLGVPEGVHVPDVGGLIDEVVEELGGEDLVVREGHPAELLADGGDDASSHDGWPRPAKWSNLHPS